MQICPSMLLPTMGALADNINKLSPYYKYFQIDIGDGIYVKNRTVQVDEIIKNYQKINNFQSIVFDFHLMVKDYESDIKKIIKLKQFFNIKNVFIHFDLLPNYQILTTSNSFPIGLALNPGDQVDDLIHRYNLNTIPSIQIMSVTPGVQGNPFLPNMLNKIQQLRLLGYRNKIFLDGAVNDKTLPIIDKLKFKPDIICPGSYLTKAKNLEKNVKYLNKYV